MPEPVGDPVPTDAVLVQPSLACAAAGRKLRLASQLKVVHRSLAPNQAKRRWTFLSPSKLRVASQPSLVQATGSSQLELMFPNAKVASQSQSATRVGNRAFSSDFLTGFRWWRICNATTHDSSEAQRVGIRRRKASRLANRKAREWLQKAARRGHAQAREVLTGCSNQIAGPTQEHR